MEGAVIMRIKTFGIVEKPVLILIHGGGLSWWSWKEQIRGLEKDYHIHTVIIDGHGEDYQNDFISIEDTATQLIAYIQENHNGSVHGICGLSIGAQIAVEILSREPDLANNWLIESVLIKPLGYVVKLIEPTISIMYPLIKQRWYAKLQSKSLCVGEADFQDYFLDSSRMSLNTLKAISRSNGNYQLKRSPIVTEKNVWIYVGSKEPKVMLESARLLANSIPNSKLDILMGYKHGELSLVHKEAYIEIIKKFKKER